MANVGILRETFARAGKENGGARALGLRFYQRLFEKYPAVKPLFHTPPEEQHKKLLASIGAIIASVENGGKLVPYLHAMGIRHVGYGTQTPHYAAVGENLLAVLAEHLSAEGQWTEEMAGAWQEALATVSGVMIDGADYPAKFELELDKAGYKPDGFRKDNGVAWEMAS